MTKYSFKVAKYLILEEIPIYDINLKKNLTAYHLLMGYLMTKLDSIVNV